MAATRFAAAGSLALALALAAPAFAADLPPAPGVDGCRPAELRSLLADDDSCVVGKACGRISFPWLYRGPRGRQNQLRFYGARTLDRQAARTLAALVLRDAAIDSACRVHAVEVSCETGDSIPVYVANFHKGGSLVRAVLRFDTGQALFFRTLMPLGSAVMGANADSLWACLAAALGWDPYLAEPRPPVCAAAEPPSLPLGGSGPADELPLAIRKVTPIYPELARLQGETGLVRVYALIGQDGTVQDAAVMEGPPNLYDSSLEAVWKWKFRPAHSNGKPVSAWVEIPVKYSLH